MVYFFFVQIMGREFQINNHLPFSIFTNQMKYNGFSQVTFEKESGDEYENEKIIASIIFL